MIYLSYYEGFGLPVLEAMSCGIPVVCSNTSCFPEVIGDIPVGVSPTSIPDIEETIANIALKSLHNAIKEQSFSLGKKQQKCTMMFFIGILSDK